MLKSNWLRRFVFSPWFVPCGLLVLCAIVYGGAIVHWRTRIVSAADCDLAGEFYYWRKFGFDALRHGHIAQWNRFVFGGAPFFAGWQPALLYPPNWIYIVLPLNLALDADMVFSTFLAGWFTSLLTSKHGMHPVACLLSGAVLMLSGGFYAHVYAGHMATLAAMAWTPLMLLAVDDLLDKPSARASVLGAFALAMQILAGHPQTTVFSVFVLAIYAAIRLVKASRPLVSAAALLVAGIAAVALDAVQILPGLQAAAEGTRSARVPIGFAGVCSFPPENFSTLAMPYLFGNVNLADYWGRSNYWEATLYLGVTATILAVAGVIGGATGRRRHWTSMAAICMVLALGQYTRLFPFVQSLPVLDKFRAFAKFDYEATIFVALLVGAGLDRLIRNREFARIASAIAGGFAVALIVAGIAWRLGWGSDVAAWVVRRDESYLFDRNAVDPALFLPTVNVDGSLQLWQAGMVAFFAAILLRGRLTIRPLAYAVAGLALVELLVFAHAMTVTFSPGVTKPPNATAWVATHPGDYKVLDLQGYPESAMALDSRDIWGYDPMVQGRYAELLKYAVTGSANDASMYLQFPRNVPVLATLGCRYVFRGFSSVPATIPNAAPHASIVYAYAVKPRRDDALAAVASASFDAARTVVLEREPSIAPQPGGTRGTVSVDWTGTDSMKIDAVTDRPAILVLTDTFSRYWTATADRLSSQRTYTVMPGNYAEIAIPLAAGRHMFTLTYCPSLFASDAAISAAAWGLLVVFALGMRRGYKNTL